MRFFDHLAHGWTCKTFGLTPSLEIVGYLSKEETQRAPDTRNILGIDINYKNFAYTVLTPPGRVLAQGYLGQQIWIRKRYFAQRRAILQSLCALKKLKGMRHKQRNYVKTNIGQLVRETILVAEKYDCDTISIERLRRFQPKGRKFNKKVMTIPFSLFRQVLEGRCFDNGITIRRIDAYHTSKWCIRCGAVNAGHADGNYALYECKNCGLVMNSDRKASMAVAAKALLERSDFLHRNNLQISGRRVPVSGLVRVSDAPGPLAVLAAAQGRGKSTDSAYG